MNQLDRLLTIMQRLRDPEHGCAWDKEQSFASLVPYTLEEAYEVADAIETQDVDGLRAELGDLLFQIVFYAQIAQEQSLFTFADICQGIGDKLIHRHPHIFTEQGSEADSGQLPTSEGVLEQWEQIKRQERAQKDQHSALDDIPLAFPALMRAQKIQKRCAAVGFDWTTLGPVVDKVYEEIDEVMFEAQQAVVDQAKLEEEMGDLLFATVNLARHLGTKAESALHQANRKFEARFRQVEAIIAQQGLEMTSASLAQKECAWQQVKAREKEESSK